MTSNQANPKNPANPNQNRSKELLDLLTSKFGGQLVESGLDLGDCVVRLENTGVFEFFRTLKQDRDLSFSMFLDVTVVDWMDSKPERFEVVYHLMSLERLYRLRVKIYVSETKPEIDSVSSLWSGANFMEREAWDMYGIKFLNHPDLRRILTYDEFKGHPLRKDYPVQGKQPRVPLLHPEVRNTAVDMNRPSLIKINPRRRPSAQFQSTQTSQPGKNV